MNGGVQNPEVKSMEVISRLKVMPKGQIVQGAKSAFRTFWRIGSRGCAIRPTPPLTHSLTQPFFKTFCQFLSRICILYILSRVLVTAAVSQQSGLQNGKKHTAINNLPQKPILRWGNWKFFLPSSSEPFN